MPSEREDDAVSSEAGKVAFGSLAERVEICGAGASSGGVWSKMVQE
jgi:hypothetical protein